MGKLAISHLLKFCSKNECMCTIDDHHTNPTNTFVVTLLPIENVSFLSSTILFVTNCAALKKSKKVNSSLIG